MATSPLARSFAEVVAKRGEGVAFGRAAERGEDARIEFRGGEGVAAGDVGEAHEGVHQGELPRVVELEAGDALSRRRDGRFRELSQLAAIDEGLQNVLLHVQVVVVDRRQGIAESREILAPIC